MRIEYPINYLNILLTNKDSFSKEERYARLFNKRIRLWIRRKRSEMQATNYAKTMHLALTLSR